MKTKLLLYIIAFASLFTACTKDPSGTTDCPPVKDVYFRFKDTFATSLVDIYKQGDTLKLKHNSGTIYYFIAQKPDSGYTFKKPVSYGTCDEDNYYMQYYQIELKSTITSITNFVIKVYYTQENLKRFRIEFNNGYYELTPGFPPL